MFKRQDLHMFGLKLNVSNSHALEVVGENLILNAAL